MNRVHTLLHIHFKINTARRNATSSVSIYSKQAHRRIASHLTLRQLATMTVNTDKVRVALLQTHVEANKQQNIANAEKQIQAAVQQNAQLVVMCEMWNCPYANSSFPVYAEPCPAVDGDTLQDYTAIDAEKAPTVYAISEMAKKYNIYLIAGSIPEISNGKLYNTSLTCNNKGQFIAKHRKVHLFDIDVPGKIRFMESDNLSAGDKLTTFNTPFGIVAVAICYDIRFAELAQLAVQKYGATILVYPGAFNTTTGPAHWELLLRARAVDNQVYALACSPARDPTFSYQAWGHSTVVDPWGTIVATTEHEPAIVTAELDLTRIAEVRRNIPITTQRRKDLYQIVEVHK